MHEERNLIVIFYIYKYKKKLKHARRKEFNKYILYIYI